MIRVMVSLGDRPRSEAVMDLLDCAGGIEALMAGQGGNREADSGAGPHVVLADPETLPGLLDRGLSEGARILLVCGEEKEEMQYPPGGRRISGIIRQGASGVVLQTAIKAVARGAAWVECAPGGIECLEVSVGDGQESLEALAGCGTDA